MMATSNGGENEKPVWKISGPIWVSGKNGEYMKIQPPTDVDPGMLAEPAKVIWMDDFSYTFEFQDDGGLLELFFGKAQRQYSVVRRLVSRMFGAN